MPLPEDSGESVSMSDEVYGPSEDTLLLLRAIEGLGKRFKRAVEIGSGSGLISARLGELSDEVHAVDISLNAIRRTRDLLKRSGVWGRAHPVCGDLLTAYRSSKLFDLIVSNPPYLEPEVGDRAIEGGWRLVDRLVEDASKRIERGGVLLIVVSSLTSNLESILEKLRGEGFSIKVVDKAKLFFEELLAVKCVKE
ncbi:MAG: hypothetical protein B6U65_03355 [Candidatus Wolframiiraptor sp. EX4484-121]|nr:MAG: hypothetical protein B6U65_03355 [Candidatus Wolframiiraptor sp. EX4484-121]